MPLSVWRFIDKNADGTVPLWINDAIHPFRFNVVVNPLEDGRNPFGGHGSSVTGAFSFDGDLTRLTTTEEQVCVFDTDLNALRGLQSLVKTSSRTRHTGSIVHDGSRLELQIQAFVFALRELPDSRNDPTARAAV